MSSPAKSIRISIGSDHRGHEQRKVLARVIQQCGHQVDDQGSFSQESTDYPDIASVVADRIVSGESELGILVCGTGIGVSIAANKIDGIRAALCKDVSTAELSRQHNDANVLCLAGNGFDPEQYQEIVKAWLEAEFEGGRHARRVDKIKNLES